MTNSTQPPERARAIEMLQERAREILLEQFAAGGWTLTSDAIGPPLVVSYDTAIEAMLAFRSEGVREAVEAAAGLVQRRINLLPALDPNAAQAVLIALPDAILATLSPEEGG